MASSVATECRYLWLLYMICASAAPLQSTVIHSHFPAFLVFCCSYCPPHSHAYFHPFTSHSASLQCLFSSWSQTPSCDGHRRGHQTALRWCGRLSASCSGSTQDCLARWLRRSAKPTASVKAQCRTLCVCRRRWDAFVPCSWPEWAEKKRTSWSKDLGRRHQTYPKPQNNGNSFDGGTLR